MANTNSWVLQTKSFFLSPCFRPAPISIGGSKDESLYHQVKCGNIAEIRKLHRDGAGLEWVDEKGQTPLILACKRSALFPVAEVLIELGANVNSYCPGPHGGTPLHHAAKHGLRTTVNLLLSHGANPLLKNGDGRTALGLAGDKGYSVVVRSIEKHICFFSGWLREFRRTSLQYASTRKFWAVVLPYVYLNQTQPPIVYLYVALYSELWVARPHAIIQLRNSWLTQPNSSQQCPTVVITDSAKKILSTLTSAKKGDRDQLLMFYNACRGISQTDYRIPKTLVASVTPTPVNPQVTTSRTPPTATTPSLEVVAVTPTPVNPQVTKSRTPTTATTPSLEVAVVTPTPVDPQVTTSRTPPTATSSSLEVVAVTPTPVNPQVTTSRTPSTATAPSLEVTVVTPTPVNPQVTTSRTPPTATAPSLEVAAVTPTPVNPQVTTSRKPPTATSPSLEVVAVTPTPVNPQVTTSRAPPIETTPSLEVAAVTPTPVNLEVTTSRTPPTTTTPSLEVATVTHTPVNPQVTTSGTPPTATTQSLEDVELAMAINASIQSAISEGALPLSVDIQSTNALPPASPLPSAPPINTDIFYNSSPIHYPSVDSSPISFTVNTELGISGSSSNTSNSCVVCLDAAVEGACIPCGHMAGCMPCLNEINARQCGCPVCRTPIQQVIKLYTM